MDHDATGSDDLVADEGVNQRGTEAEAAGRDPGDDAHAGTGAPGAAAAGDQGLLDAAPEPNEPA